MSSIDCFISLHRLETLSIHQLTTGYQLSHLPWLSKLLPSSLQQKIFADLIYWIFAEFIVSALAGNFYITEGEGTGTETLYFKKRDWRLLEEVGMNQMNSNFMKVSLSCHVLTLFGQ
jgi:sugar (pentulose or hexulose) kinase